jgi:hypothetical protein
MNHTPEHNVTGADEGMFVSDESYGPLSDEALTEIAAETLRVLDAEEAAQSCSVSPCLRGEHGRDV